MVRVGLSGVLATLIDVITLIALVELVGVHVTIAAFVAALNGGVTNFLVNKYWAFNDRSRIAIRQVGSYTAVAVVTALFVAAAVHVFAVVLGLPYLIAKALAAVTVFLAWSYPAQAKLVFPRAARIPRSAA